MYKIETHLHTKYSSRCGHMDEKALVESYLNAGYSAILVTDHYNRDTFLHLNMDTKGNGDFVGGFLTGWRHMKEEGERRGLRIYRGAELRFDECFNDYLMLNYPEELLVNPEEVFAMGLERFSARARSAGALLIQAHPYRRGCTPADHRFLDGVEVLNRNPDHDNHNDLALEYVDRWPGLIRTSGSDCHWPHHVGHGGIVAETLPEDDAGLVRLLRSGEYRLL